MTVAIAGKYAMSLHLSGLGCILSAHAGRGGLHMFAVNVPDAWAFRLYCVRIPIDVHIFLIPIAHIVV